jgi:hypothetical protein
MSTLENVSYVHNLVIRYAVGLENVSYVHNLVVRCAIGRWDVVNVGTPCASMAKGEGISRTSAVALSVGDIFEF